MALSIAIPVMLQQLIQNLVSLIDNFMVAGLGDISMSGVNIAGQINFVFLVLITGLCTTGGIFMSQYNGAKDSEGMQQAFRFKLIVGLLCANIYTAVCYVNPAPLLCLMVHGNENAQEIVVVGTDYMRAVSWSWIPMVVSLAIGSSLREIDKVKPPLMISVCATIVNTVLNYFLIYGNCGFPRLEVVGAAFATVVARIFEMVIFIVYIYKVKPPFFVRLCDFFNVRIKLFFTILVKFAMILISEMCWVMSETITTALYNSRGGADVVSGMAAGFAITNLIFVAFTGVHTATGVILGGTLGANRLEEARNQRRWLQNGALVLGFFATGIGCLSTVLIPLVFANLSLASRNIARGLLLVNSVYMPSWIYVNSQFAISRVGGDTIMGVIVDVGINALMVIPGMFALTYLTNLGPVIMYAIIKLTDFLKIFVAGIWLKKERWLKCLTQ